MDLSHGNFYKTIAEAETAIKQYSKGHYLMAVAIRPVAGRQLMQAIRPALLPDG